VQQETDLVILPGSAKREVTKGGTQSEMDL